MLSSCLICPQRYTGDMTRYDYLIIGNGIAAVTAAETIRERDSQGSIAILSDEPHLLYSRVLLPSYLKRRISREKLFLRTIDDFLRRAIDLFPETAVAAVDTKEKNVLLRNGKRIGYEKLLIASGGRVKPWGTPADAEYVYRLQTLGDADRLMHALPRIKHALVVGSSFIALEFLEIFVLNQIAPTLVIRGAHFFPEMLDAGGGEMLGEQFKKHNIVIRADDEIGEIAATGRALRIKTKALRDVEADGIAVGVGVERNHEFLAGSGIEVGARGIKTNEFLETNASDVWAAGDVAEFYDVILEKRQCLGNWTNAFLQGKAAGLAMTGGREPFRAVSSYSITNLGFQITALGDVSDASDAIVRLDRARMTYERLFLRSGRLVGAALINKFQDRAHLSRLIEGKTPIESYRERLGDPGFDIGEIVG